MPRYCQSFTPANKSMPRYCLTYSWDSSLSPLTDPHIFFFFFRFSLSPFPLLTLSSCHFFFFPFPIPSNPLLSFSYVFILLALIHALTQWQWALNLKVSDRNKLKEKKSNTKTHFGRSLHFGRYSPKHTEIAEIHRNGSKFVLEFFLMGSVSHCYECAKGATLHSNSLLLCLFGFTTLEIRIKYAYLVVSEYQCEWLWHSERFFFWLLFIILLIVFCVVMEDF